MSMPFLSLIVMAALHAAIILRLIMHLKENGSLSIAILPCEIYRALTAVRAKVF